MAGINLAGTGENLDASLNTIISAHKLLRDEDGKMRRLCTRYTLEPHTGTSKVILNYGRVTAYVQTDGVDTAQGSALSDTQSTYTPSEVAAQVILAGSTIRRVADTDLLRRTGQILEAAFALKEDQDGTAQFPSFTTSIGAANTVLSVGSHMSAVTRLQYGSNRANPEPAPEPWFATYHPCSLHAILGRLVPLTDVPTGTNVYTGAAAGQTVMGGGGNGGITEEILRKWKVKELGGVPVIPEANISVDSSDDATNCMFSREGLIYISEVEPHLVPDKSDGSMRDAVEFTYWGSYGYGVYRPAAYGCGLVGDATQPTQ